MTPVIDIIDDDEAVRDSTHALLESYGYEVREHPSAEAFLDHSGQEPVCLLVDHHLPGMTGVELLEHLRAKGVQTPALVVTSRRDPAIVPRVVHELRVPVPQIYMDRMKGAENAEAARAAGIAIAREMTIHARPMTAGVQLSAPFGRYEMAIQVAEAIGPRE